MLDPSPTIANDPRDRIPVAPYDTNVTSLRHLGREHEQALIAQARSGDQAACDEMLLWLRSPVQRFAVRYYLAYYWEASGSVSPDDLVSEAIVRMLERLPSALTASNPFAYLLSVAYGTIRSTLAQERSPIRTPYTPGERPIPVKSLDAPLEADSDETLLDVIQAQGGTPSASSEAGDATPIAQAVMHLSETERAVLAECYGLYETAPASMDTILTQLGRAGMGCYKAHALAKLYRLLSSVYPQYCGGGYVQDLRPPGKQLSLSAHQLERLEVAYAQLQASGQKITVHALTRAAGINTGHVSSYLHQQGYMPSSRQQRLEAAYAQLQVSGQKITVKLLAQAAHVGGTHASLYLQQCSGSHPPPYQPRVQPEERDRAVRVAAAYTKLQASGQKITRRTLGAAAHVNWHYAAAYIQQMQAEQGEASTSREVPA